MGVLFREKGGFFFYPDDSGGYRFLPDILYQFPVERMLGKSGCISQNHKFHPGAGNGYIHSS
jgi:hypothetical protein